MARGDPSSATPVEKLAISISKKGSEFTDTFDAKNIAMTLNALSKWPSDPCYKKAAQRLAELLNKREPDCLDTFNKQHTVKALHALSK